MPFELARNAKLGSFGCIVLLKLLVAACNIICIHRILIDMNPLHVICPKENVNLKTSNDARIITHKLNLISRKMRDL